MSRSFPKHSVLIAILFGMSALTGISSDMYIAALPIMGHEFGVPADLMKWTLSLFFIGLACSQLIYGPCSDYIGRKKILAVGFIVYLLGALICVLSKNFSFFLFGRLIQGCGVGATACLSRAILRDAFDGVTLAKALSYVGMGLAVVPAIAPMLGAYVQTFAGWRIEFLLMFFYALILLIIAISVVPETNVYVRQDKKTVKFIFVGYRVVLSDPVFFINVVVASFIVAMIYIFYFVTSFYLQGHHHWSAVEYSQITIVLAGTLFSGRKVNTWLVQFMPNNQVILLGSILGLLSAIMMLVFFLLQLDIALTLLLPIGLYAFSGGIVFSNTFVGATEKYKKAAGSVSSLYGFTQMLIVFCLLSFSYFLKLSSVESIYKFLFVFSFLSILMVVWLIKNKK